MARSIIIVTPGPEAWGNFKKYCKAKGLQYQTLANQKKVPKIGKKVEIRSLILLVLKHKSPDMVIPISELIQTVKFYDLVEVEVIVKNR